jgi:AAA family ATPase
MSSRKKRKKKANQAKRRLHFPAASDADSFTQSQSDTHTHTHTHTQAEHITPQHSSSASHRHTGRGRERGRERGSHDTITGPSPSPSTSTGPGSGRPGSGIRQSQSQSQSLSVSDGTPTPTTTTVVSGVSVSREHVKLRDRSSTSLSTSTSSSNMLNNDAYLRDRVLIIDRVVHGWNKGLCNENSILVSPSMMQRHAWSAGSIGVLQSVDFESVFSESSRLQCVVRIWPSSSIRKQMCRLQCYGDMAAMAQHKHRVVFHPADTICKAQQCVLELIQQVKGSDSSGYTSGRGGGGGAGGSSVATPSTSPAPSPVTSHTRSASTTPSTTPSSSSLLSPVPSPALLPPPSSSSSSSSSSSPAKPRVVAAMQVSVAQLKSRVAKIVRESTAFRTHAAQQLHDRILLTGMQVSLPVLQYGHWLFHIRRIVACDTDTDTGTVAEHKQSQHRHDIAPKHTAVYQITRDTALSFAHAVGADISSGSNMDSKHTSSASSSAPTYDSIGGLNSQVALVREMLELPLMSPEHFVRMGVRPPKGILLYGPPGTGKTLIARAVASEVDAHMIIVNGPELLSKFVGESEAKLRAVFTQANERSPSVIFIDEIDSLCPARDDAKDDMHKRIVSTLLTLMDGVIPSSRVVVIAATNRPNSLDQALRRPGRFDREVEIGIPSAAGRLDILTRMLSSMPNSITPSELQDVASRTHGFVGADLKALCREAAIHAIKRSHTTNTDANDNDNDGATQDTDDSLLVSDHDLSSALVRVRPSAMREVYIEVPNVKWSDVGGQDVVKQKLREAIELPLTHPEAFARMNIRPPRGILMYGPPGCSKTLMAKALATESSRNFIAIKGPELFSKWVGESERAIHQVFRKARAASPSIVFFDEIDSIATHRNGGDGTSGSGSSNDGASSVANRVLSQLLIELDGVEPLQDVAVIAATNRPDLIDRALLRPGRIDRILFVSPPDVSDAAEIFNINLKTMCHEADVDVKQLAELTSGYSGAEIAAVCREAAIQAMEESLDIQAVAMRHFIAAIPRIKPRITQDMLDFYHDFASRTGLAHV